MAPSIGSGPAVSRFRDLGPRPELLWLPLADLHVDPAYQRSLERPSSQKAIEKLAAGFAWRSFQLPTVARDPAGGYLVIDGQHRVEAARRIGLEEVPCYVVEAAARAQQADGFIRINTDRVTVDPYALHRARLVAGDAEARTIARLCAGVGVEIPAYPVGASSLKPNQTLALAAIRDAWRSHGEAAVQEALRLLREAYGARPGNLRPLHIRALAAWLADRPAFDRAALVATLGAVDSRRREREARDLAHQCGDRAGPVLIRLILSTVGKATPAPGSRSGAGDPPLKAAIPVGPESYRKPSGDRPDESKQRKCLGCGEHFLSTHKGNRLCSGCKANAARNAGGIDEAHGMTR